MPEYLSPGVYVEEISTGPVPIEGVSTSTAGFVGQTERGPTTPRLVTSWLDFQRWFGRYVDTSISFLPYAIQGFFDNGGQRAFVARVTKSDAKSTSQDLATGNGAQKLHVEASGPGAWGNRMFVRVQPGKRRGFRLTILYYRTMPPLPFVDPTDIKKIADPNRKEPDVVEDYDDLGFSADDPNYVLTTVNSASKLVDVKWTDPTQAGGKPNSIAFTQLGTGGTDGSNAAIKPDDYIGDGTKPPNERKGLAGLEIIDQVSLLCVPDEVSTTLNPGNKLTNEIVNQCLRLKDRFAVLQTLRGQTDFNALSQSLPTTDYAAVYYPWIRVLDPVTQDGLLIPPGGHVTGVYARTDIERGVHKAPANEDVRGIITRDLDEERGPLEFKIGKGEQDILNPLGINVIRDFRPDRRGIRVWGARTRTADPQWKYVSVRRLFIFVEESIDEGTQWVVFEPNDENTWARVVRSISRFLTSVWRGGALMGTTAEEAFFVKCDRTTMTPDDIDNGRLICYIGIAPVKPAEFVIFRISQKTIEFQQS